jgi:hypothetical protein
MSYLSHIWSSKIERILGQRTQNSQNHRHIRNPEEVERNDIAT